MTAVKAFELDQCQLGSDCLCVLPDLRKGSAYVVATSPACTPEKDLSLSSSDSIPLSALDCSTSPFRSCSSTRVSSSLCSDEPCSCTTSTHTEAESETVMAPTSSSASSPCASAGSYHYSQLRTVPLLADLRCFSQGNHGGLYNYSGQ